MKIFELEKELISNKNRFKLNYNQKKELKKDFKHSIILIIGAAGSIGSKFTKELKIYNFKKIYLIDKDENQLTELNRDLISLFKKKIFKIQFICNDLNLINLDRFINDKKITHYINFSAVKHVRSEENLDSIGYMMKTNFHNFLPKKLKKSSKLRKVFSISTDKAVYPSSILGLTKKLMEQKLYNFKKRFPHIGVSTTRFANVSFSNGSALKMIIDKFREGKDFGIPKKVERYFITHEEAVALCLKSLLSNCDGSILIPNFDILKKQIKIYDILLKISKILKLKFNKSPNKLIFSNRSKVFLISKNIIGQKLSEKLNEKQEELISINNDKTVYKINFKKGNYFKNISFLKKIKNLNKLKLFLRKKVVNYKPTRSDIGISKNI